VVKLSDYRQIGKKRIVKHLSLLMLCVLSRKKTVTSPDKVNVYPISIHILSPKVCPDPDCQKALWQPRYTKFINIPSIMKFNKKRLLLNFEGKINIPIAALKCGKKLENLEK